MYFVKEKVVHIQRDINIFLKTLINNIYCFCSFLFAT